MASPGLLRAGHFAVTSLQIGFKDMSRLQSMAFLLLSKLLYSKDTDVLNAAYDLATKSNDLGLVLWANSQIIGYFFSKIIDFSANLDLHSFNGRIEDANQISALVDVQKRNIEVNRSSCMQSLAHLLIQVIIFTCSECSSEF